MSEILVKIFLKYLVFLKYFFLAQERQGVAYIL